MQLWRYTPLLSSSLVVAAAACFSESDHHTSSPPSSGGQTVSTGSGQGGASSTGGPTAAGGSGGGAFSSGFSSGSGGGPPSCDAKLLMTVRDFSKSHSDFESFTGDAAYTGLVESTLGIDGTPTYAHSGGTPQTTGPQAFAHWYHDVPGVNETFAVEIDLLEAEAGVFFYENAAFFPIDNMGFGNEGFANNFHFTTEVHTSFEYKGGETFSFTGDDDLWLFINGRLAIDLGGLHPELSESVALDAHAAELGITIGNAYPMDIFHAERHTDHSNYRIQTTIDCFKPVDPK